MKAFIGVTDYDWFELLRSQPFIEDVNFWQLVFLLSDLNLRHDFYEVDHLSENDRTRYTIHPDAYREVLKRLFELKHMIHAQEVADGLWVKK